MYVLAILHPIALVQRSGCQVGKYCSLVKFIHYCLGRHVNIWFEKQAFHELMNGVELDVYVQNVSVDS